LEVVRNDESFPRRSTAGTREGSKGSLGANRGERENVISGYKRKKKGVPLNAGERKEGKTR